MADSTGIRRRQHGTQNEDDLPIPSGEVRIEEVSTPAEGRARVTERVVPLSDAKIQEKWTVQAWLNKAMWQLSVLTAIGLVPVALASSVCVFGVLLRVFNPPSFQIPVNFVPLGADNSLVAEATIPISKLKYSKTFDVSLVARLPETEANLEASSFKVSMSLNNGAGSCIARFQSTGAMKFQSSALRSIKSFVLFVPYMLGFLQEQRVHMRMKPENPFKIDASMKQLLAKLSVSPAEMRISEAKLRIHTRRPFFAYIALRHFPVSTILGSAAIWAALFVVFTVSLVVLKFMVKRWYYQMPRSLKPAINMGLNMLIPWYITLPVRLSVFLLRYFRKGSLDKDAPPPASD
mmetsp:Transcript_8858/g.26614  ORF Transcript_8858/g.26614 Transcript_8858/m.26614 type:complete len:348 (-) Transcript_8858:329-1372(-)|eukprot:CAMPEP_0198726484 /NCGR_PEP_ID=MMETSP1475-20131203/3521_1 /TAXON_ID= ORGANISM="Unidentified sp., Strain CCMP1999" /NCGR_SAMPLE_ID=MMETSP1475 /ASSEMBLY_ACC=CAM_ASM_001111 /LENGTH=347 /DNA_ID=CAMNT_0044488407 /DNA_START=75 /DNA_END=1118 /DNA_ORIENTATION=+